MIRAGRRVESTREGGEGMMSEQLGPGAARAVPGEVGLYGLGHYTPVILDLCRNLGTRVAFVVDDRPEDQPVHKVTTCLQALRAALMRARVPVLTESEFFRRLERQEPLPPLIASRVAS